VTDSTKYEGNMGYIYYPLLLSHIILAAVQAPLVLYAFMYGFTGQIERHKKLVKVSYPVWLYVCVTGVICYLMIAPYYK
jgi:putative membrane protein